MQVEPQVCIHATTVAWQGRGVLILGRSGSGKSALALNLLALGCDLVADDQTELTCVANTLIANCPKAIKGRIEARGFGILTAETACDVAITCAIDLDATEDQRLPDKKSVNFCDLEIRLFHKTDITVLPFAILQYLKSQTLAQEQSRFSA